MEAVSEHADELSSKASELQDALDGLNMEVDDEDGASQEEAADAVRTAYEAMKEFAAAADKSLASAAKAAANAKDGIAEFERLMKEAGIAKRHNGDDDMNAQDEKIIANLKSAGLYDALKAQVSKDMTAGDVHVSSTGKGKPKKPVAFSAPSDGNDKEPDGDPDDVGKGNDNHDENGRFASGSGGGSSRGRRDRSPEERRAAMDRLAAEMAAEGDDGDKPAASERSSGWDRVADEMRGTKKSHEEDFRTTIHIAKVDPDQRLIFGWASVSQIDGEDVIDKQGDVIPIEELEKAAYEFMLRFRQHGDMHSDVGTGYAVESMVFTPEKAALGMVAKVEGQQIYGWFVGFKIESDQVWKDIKGGIRPEFSIGGRASSTEE
jgi:hypothetical protein